MFNSDYPIDNIVDDQLNRRVFAQNIATAIMTYGNDTVITDDNNKSNCLTIGIYGGWGEGKSSLANMILSYIQKQYEDDNDGPKPVIINFNPWMYSNKEDLIKQLFVAISSIFSKSNIDETINNSADKIDFAGKMIKFGGFIPFPGFKEVCSTISDLLTNYADSLKDLSNKNEKSLSEIKYELNNELKSNNIKLIITIDDFDRLSQSEIRLMFQVIKALGDFENTTYLLLMDKDVVVKSLENVQGGSGEDYLKKIVQVPINIPNITPSQLNTILHKKFKAIVKDEKYKNMEKRFDITINNCVIPFICNIRDIKRIFNLFEFKNSFLNGNVNLVDLFALCAIELYIPEMYNQIKIKKEQLCQLTNVISSNISNDIIKLNSNLDLNKIQTVINTLFSKDTIESHYSRRINDTNYFDSFFSLSLPSEYPQYNQIEDIIKTDSSEAILTKLFNTNFITDSIIREIQENINNCTPERLTVIFEALYSKYDDLLTMYNVNNLSLDYIMEYCLHNMKFDDLKNCFEKAVFNNYNSSSISILLEFFDYNEKNHYLNDEQMNIIIELCKNKFTNMELFKYNDEKAFRVILKVWKKIDFSSCKYYISHNYKDDKNAFKLIHSMVSPSTIIDIEGKPILFIKTYELNSLVNIHELYELIVSYTSPLSSLDVYKESTVAFMLICESKEQNEIPEGKIDKISYSDVQEKLNSYE